VREEEAAPKACKHPHKPKESQQARELVKACHSNHFQKFERVASPPQILVLRDIVNHHIERDGGHQINDKPRRQIIFHNHAMIHQDDSFLGHPPSKKIENQIQNKENVRQAVEPEEVIDDGLIVHAEGDAVGNDQGVVDEDEKDCMGEGGREGREELMRKVV